jgi:hypothetical protein
MSAFRSFLRYFGLATEPDAAEPASSAPWPVGDPVATLERLRSEAVPVPLTSEVRVDRQRANDAIEALRGSSETANRLYDLLANAKPVPLTDQVRVDRDALNRLIDRIQAGA